VCALTRELAIVDSFIVDDEELNVRPIPWMEFYENRELGNQVDNRVGPTPPCLLALCRSAGARVEYISTTHRHALVACYRSWEPLPEHPSTAPPVLTAVATGRLGDFGINFDSRAEEFVACWFDTSDERQRREDLRVEIGGFGVHAVFLNQTGQKALAAFLLPPGLGRGWHTVRLRTTRSHFSEGKQIAVDIPIHVKHIDIRAATDSLDCRKNAVSLESGGYLTLWIEGVAENADRNNIRVYWEHMRLPVDHISIPDESRIVQVNVRVPSSVGTGPCRLEVRHGNARAGIVVDAY
jgi:hypothetical protein